MQVDRRGWKRKRPRYAKGTKFRRVSRPPVRARRRNARIAGFLGIEKKFYDTSLYGGTLSESADCSGGEHNPSATICLNSVVQGDGESNRDGRKIVMKYISVNGTISMDALSAVSTITPNMLIDVMIVLDQQTNGALMASENLYVNPSANASLGTRGFRNLQYIQRFKVLKKVSINTGPSESQSIGATYDTGGSHHPFSMNVPLADIAVNYTGTTETIANIVDNSLNLIALVKDGGASTATINYNARLRFVG